MYSGYQSGDRSPWVLFAGVIIALLAIATVLFVVRPANAQCYSFETAKTASERGDFTNREYLSGLPAQKVAASVWPEAPAEMIERVTDVILLHSPDQDWDQDMIRVLVFVDGCAVAFSDVDKSRVKKTRA